MASFSANPTSGAVPLTVSFTDTSTGSPTGWSWDFGDGSPLSTLQNPGHTYTLAGTYTVKLTASNSGGSNTATHTGYISAAPNPKAGFRGPSFLGVTYPPTSDKPESKLWWNDGIWWADMFERTSGHWHIFRLDRSTETWVDTGTQIDPRPGTLADALWDGTHLYVASHVVTISTDTQTVPSLPASPAYLYRFSYSPSDGSYTLDPGFPATITTWSSESMTVDKDSTGVLWATWTQVSGSTSAVYVNSSTPGNDATWGTPFVLPVGSVAHPSPDDISALVSYKNSYVGVLWSNQLTGSFYWAVHRDGDPATSWQESVALQGSNAADDHINLKTLQSDAAGRVYAAVKTSADLTGPDSAALIDLLVFKPGTGEWAQYTFGTVADCHTRPLVVLDSDHQMVHMFATAPAAGDDCLYTGVPGSIYEKTAPMDNPVFPTGPGTPVIQDPSSPSINDATSTKQQVTSATGIVVLASNGATNHYWFMDESLGGTVPPVASFSANPTSGTVPLTVSFTDTSTGSPTGWSWDFGDGSPLSTLQNPGHTYTLAGTYTVKLTASNSGGSNTAQGTITVNAPAVPPVASFSANPTSGTVPLTVSFTDTSTGSPTGWSWDFGDGSPLSTLQNPGHTYTLAGTYTVKLTASNSGGSNTAQGTITVNAPAVPPVASFTANPTSGTVPLTVSFTDTSTGSPTGWSWDFGDGSPLSTLQNPGHTYTLAGTYTVKLDSQQLRWLEHRSRDGHRQRAGRTARGLL